MKITYFLSLLFVTSNLFAQNISRDVIAYHIYLTSMSSMPYKLGQSHTCKSKIMSGNSIFGNSTTSILESSDEFRTDKSRKLADDILRVASAFNFASKYEIGYWLGIIHKESLFCLNVCGGKNCPTLKKKISHMRSMSPPYADLGIGQVNYLTLRSFIAKKLNIYRPQFETLIQGNHFRRLGLNSFKLFKTYLQSLIPTKQDALSIQRRKIKKLYDLFINDHKMNLAISLPILLEKIKNGMNIDDISDKHSRLQLYQKSKTFRKYSEPFIRNHPKLSRANQYVWKRSFGVITYNGHKKHAIDYAFDVYCIKSLYDSLLLRSKETTLRYVYKEKGSPFYEFYKSNGKLNLGRCEQMLKMMETGDKRVAGKTEELIPYENFVSTYKAPKEVLKMKVGGSIYKYKFKTLEVSEIIKDSCNVDYCHSIEEIGYKDNIYMYSFIRKILYPRENYDFTSEQYKKLQKYIISINPHIKSNALEETDLIKFPDFLLNL